jgi:hypothetical protein
MPRHAKCQLHIYRVFAMIAIAELDQWHGESATHDRSVTCLRSLTRLSSRSGAYPELMAELDAIKRERIGGLMLRRDWGDQRPRPTEKGGLGQMSRTVKAAMCVPPAQVPQFEALGWDLCAINCKLPSMSHRYRTRGACGSRCMLPGPPSSNRRSRRSNHLGSRRNSRGNRHGSGDGSSRHR